MMPGVDLCLVPAGIAPNGQLPNLLDPPSLQPAVIAITTVMLGLAFVVLAGRLFVNRKSLKLPDWLMVVGFIFDVGVMGTELALSRRFRHIWDTPLCHIMGGYMKMTYVVDIMTGPALFFPKAAIFLFYIQIFSSDRKVRLGSIIGIVAAFMAYFPVSLVISYWHAPHMGQNWDELVMNNMPHKGIPGAITIGVASVIVDIYIFVLPLPTLAKLNMPLAKRVQVISLFATAFLAVAASVICMVYRIKLLVLEDATWQAGVVAIPIIIENNVAIIVGSLPAFAVFMRKYVARSSLYKSLHSKLFNSGRDSSDDEERVGTFGGSNKKRRGPSYSALSGGSSPPSQITVPEKTHKRPQDADQDVILRTVEFTVEENRTR